MRGVYVIINTVSWRYYIGSSIDIRKRWRAHRTDMNTRRHNNPHLVHAWHRYGRSAFAFLVVEIVPDADDLLAAEQKWLDAARDIGAALYNVAITAGAPARGVKLSEAHRRAIGAAHRGMKRSAEARRNISESRKGSTLTEEHKAKIAEKMRTRVFTQAHREALSRAGKGRRPNSAGKPISEETRERMRLGAAKRNASPEYRAKLSEANKRRVQSPETRAKISAARREMEARKREQREGSQ